MLNLDNGDLIQAFPIHKDTIIGELSNQPTKGYCVLLADEEMIVTIVFPGNYINFPLVRGECISISEDSLVISTDGVCKFS